MRTDLTLLLQIAALMAIGLAPAPADAQRRTEQRAPEFSMLLLPESHTQILEIAEIPIYNPARSPVAPPQRRRAVTDLSLRLSTAGNEPLADVLALPNGARAGRVLFLAELSLVSNGRLLVEQRLNCGAWLQNIALCKNTCGEGALVLVRNPETPGLTMAIGRTPRRDGEGFHEGLRLGVCSADTDATPATTLVPMRNVKVAEIGLRTP